MNWGASDALAVQLLTGNMQVSLTYAACRWHPSCSSSEVGKSPVPERAAALDLQSGVRHSQGYTHA